MKKSVSVRSYPVLDHSRLFWLKKLIISNKLNYTEFCTILEILDLCVAAIPSANINIVGCRQHLVPM